MKRFISLLCIFWLLMGALPAGASTITVTLNDTPSDEAVMSFDDGEAVTISPKGLSSRYMYFHSSLGAAQLTTGSNDSTLWSNCTWIVYRSDTPGYYYFQNKATRTFLSICYTPSFNYAFQRYSTGRPGADELWKVVVSQGRYTFIPKSNSGMALSYNPSSSSSNYPLKVEANQSQSSTQFQLGYTMRIMELSLPTGRTVPDGAYRLRPQGNTGCCVGVRTDVTPNEAMLYNDSNDSSRQWVFTHLGKGLYSIKNKSSGKYLGVSNSGKGIRFVLEADSTPFLSQKWYVIRADGGHYLVPLCDINAALSVDGTLRDGADLRRLGLTRGDYQRFTLDSGASVEPQPTGTLKVSADRNESEAWYFIQPKSNLNYAVAVTANRNGLNTSLQALNHRDKKMWWRLRYIEKGQYIFENGETGKRLRYDRSNGNVIQATGGMTPAADDMWHVVTKDGARYIVPAGDHSKAMDLIDGIFPAARVNVRNQTLGTGQQFVLTNVYKQLTQSERNLFNSGLDSLGRPHSRTLDNDIYRISMRKDGKTYALTASESGGVITLSPYVNGNKYQQWRFKYEGNNILGTPDWNGAYHIENMGTKLCLDVNGSDGDRIVATTKWASRYPSGYSLWYPCKVNTYYTLVPMWKQWSALALPGSAYDSSTWARLAQHATTSIPDEQKLRIEAVDEVEQEPKDEKTNWWDSWTFKIFPSPDGTSETKIETDPKKDPNKGVRYDDVDPEDDYSTHWWFNNDRKKTSLEVELSPGSLSAGDSTASYTICCVTLGASPGSPNPGQATATREDQATGGEKTYLIGDIVLNGSRADMSLADSDTGEALIVTMPVYTISATVTYDANGGTDAPPAQEKLKGIDLQLSDWIPQREGYGFAGWSADPEGEAAYQPGDWYAPDESATLYALWQPEEGGRTVIGEVEEVTVDESTVTVRGWAFDTRSPGESLMIHLQCGDANALDTGFTANEASEAVNAAHGIGGNHGFNDTSIYTTINLMQPGSLTGAQRVRISALPANGGPEELLYEGMHEFGGQYSLTYDAAGGADAPERQTGAKGTALTVSEAVPTRVGYGFSGWALDPDAGQADYQPGDTYARDDSATLYALWDADGADAGFTGRMDRIRADGDTLYVYGVVWDDTNSQNDVRIEVESNETVIAGFNRSDHYISGTGLSAEYTLFGFEHTLQVDLIGDQPVRIYAASPDGARRALMYAGTLSFGNTYTVTYEANGGEGAPQSQTKVQGQPLTLSSVAPTRAGYRFMGWSEGLPQGNVHKSGSEWTNDRDAILQAVWYREDADIALPSSLKTIEADAFLASRLGCVKLPEGCESIGPRAFAYCDALKQVYIPDSVTEIAGNAFAGDSNVLFVTNNVGAMEWAWNHGYGWIYIPGSTPGTQVVFLGP